MKWILFIIMALMLVPIVASANLDDCKRVMVLGDVPCTLLGSWTYTEPCNTFQVNIWNSTPTNIINYTMGDYGLTGKCNATWDITTPGSYMLNYSSGDSAIIIIELEDNMIAIIIGLIAVITFFGIMGVKMETFGAKMFANGLALIELLLLVFVLFLKESNLPLVSILEVNFKVMFVLAFGIGILALYKLTTKLINPSDDVVKENEEEKW